MATKNLHSVLIKTGLLFFVLLLSAKLQAQPPKDLPPECQCTPMPVPSIRIKGGYAAEKTTVFRSIKQALTCPLRARTISLRGGNYEKFSREKLEKNLPEFCKLNMLELKNLDLGKCPENLGVLITLKYLYITNCKLNELQVSVANLRLLKWLQLKENQLSSLPYDLKDLKNLESCDISDNLFTEFPKVLLELRTLNSIELQNNQLTKIPENISILTELRYLNLSNNQITTLPSSIKDLRLDQLSLTGNPISEQHLNEIRQWLPDTHISF